MRILIATDGSEFSKAAIDRYCSTFAKPDDEVRLVSVVEPMTHVVGAPFGVVDDYYNTYIREARSEAAIQVEEAKTAIAERCGISSITTELIVGPPARSIIEDAADWKADLIMMGSHGRGFWKRVYLGSVSSSVVHHAPCSVLVVRTQS